MRLGALSLRYERALKRNYVPYQSVIFMPNFDVPKHINQSLAAEVESVLDESVTIL